MTNKNLSKDIFNAVKKKSGKNISEKDINKLASNVNPRTVQSEAQLRQLIRQVSKMANVAVSESTEKEIIQAVKSSGLNPNNLEQLMKMMLKK
ncbi:MAG TPA: stage VI sporulation protein F [Bacilli bacterium]